MTSTRKIRIAAAIILVLGLAQMAGDLLKVPAIKAIAGATMISPQPKVFTAHLGYETYSANFVVEWADNQGKVRKLEITPAVYGKVLGPYQRRNVYGAVLSYGPIMVTDERMKPIFESVSVYAMCGEAPLLNEIGIDSKNVVGPVKVHVIAPPTTSFEGLPTTLEVSCPQSA